MSNEVPPCSASEETPDPGPIQEIEIVKHPWLVEIEQLRASLEERTRERDEWRGWVSALGIQFKEGRESDEQLRGCVYHRIRMERERAGAAEATLKQRDAYIAELRAPEELDALMERHGEEMAFLQGQLAMSRGLAQQAEATLKATQDEKRAAFRAGFLANIGGDYASRGERLKTGQPYEWTFDGIPGNTDLEPQAWTAWEAALTASPAAKKCSHNHTVRQVGCVSCVLVFDRPADRASPAAKEPQ